MDARGRLPTSLPGLTLSELGASDADRYYALLDVNRDHLGGFGDYQPEVHATRTWVTAYFAAPPDENVRFGMFLDGKLIGRVDLDPVDPPRYSIGYWLSADQTGRGYATVACRAALDYCRDVLAGSHVFAGVTHGNAKSAAVLVRLGFTKVAEFETYDRYHLALQAPAPAYTNKAGPAW